MLYSDKLPHKFDDYFYTCIYSRATTDLIATWQSVHLHQLTLGVQHQLGEGQQLRGKRAFGDKCMRLG